MAFKQAQKRPFLQRPPFVIREKIVDANGNQKYPKVIGDDISTFDDARKAAEFERCATDPVYFISNYCIVRHPLDGLVPFIPYGFQTDFVIPGFMDHQFAITRKFRQGGFTTTAAGLCLWISQFDLDREILIVSKTDREAMEFLRMIYRMYDYLPGWLRSGYKTSNEHVFDLDTGSRILAYTPTVGVSYGCYLLVIDEAGRVSDMDSKWGDMFPVLSTGGKCWVISTCNGMSGKGRWYYKKWIAAQNSESYFHCIDVPYTAHPEYNNPEYVATMRKELGERLFRQEVLREFLGVTGGVFREELIREYDEKLCVIKPLAVRPCPMLPKTSEQKNLFIWNDPEPNVRYIVALDIGEGLGSNSVQEEKADEYDYSVVQILRMDNLAQVAEYRNDGISPPDFARVACALGHAYNDAVIVAEDGPLGQHVLTTAHRSLGYSNIYSSRPGKKLGLAITEAQRQMIVNMLIDILAAKRAEIKSIRCVNEMRTLIMNARTGKIEHDSGEHDDCLMALGYGYFARQGIVGSLPPMANIAYKDIYAPSVEQAAPPPEPVLPAIHQEGLADAIDIYNQWGGFPAAKK